MYYLVAADDNDNITVLDQWNVAQPKCLGDIAETLALDNCWIVQKKDFYEI